MPRLQVRAHLVGLRHPAQRRHGTYRPRITALRAELEDYVRRKYADAYEKGYSVCPGVWVIDSSHQLPTRLKARRQRARE